MKRVDTKEMSKEALARELDKLKNAADAPQQDQPDDQLDDQPDDQPHDQPHDQPDDQPDDPRDRLADRERDEDRERLIAELQVHQVELETQNRELQQVQQLLEESRSRYADLYDFAPVGYFTLTPRGRIDEINLTGAILLGLPRELLLGRSFAAVVSLKDRRAFDAHLESCAQRKTRVTTELTFSTKKSASVVVQMVSVPAYDASGAVTGFRTTLNDISAMKQLENRLRFLAGAGETLASALDFRGTLTAVARLSVPVLADLCLIDVVDEHGDIQRVGVEFADSAQQARLAERLKGLVPRPELTTPQAQVIASGEAVFLADELAARRGAAANIDQEHWAAMTAAGITSLMCVPLVARGRSLGVITFATTETHRRYSPADLVFAEDVARRVGTAIDNARLYDQAQHVLEAERQARAEAEALRQETAHFYRMTDAMNRAEMGDTACEAGLMAIEHLLHVDRAAVLLFDDAGVMRFKAWRGLSPTYREAVDGHSPWSVDEANARSVLVRDVETDPSWAGRLSVFRAEKIRSLLFIPLGYGNRLIGKLMVYDESPWRLDARALQQMETVAGHLAQSLGRIQAGEAVRRFQSQTEEARALLDTLLSQAPVGFAFWDRDLRCVRANAALADLDGLPVENHLGKAVSEVLPGALGDRVSKSLRQVIDTGRPIRAQEISAGSADPSVDRRECLASYYPVLGHSGDILGVGAMLVDITERRRAEQRLRVLSDASGLLASSLDHEVFLGRLPDIVVPDLAGWCIVDLVENGQGRRLRVTTSDPRRQLVADMLARFQPDWSRPHLSYEALRNGEALLLREVTDGYLQSIAQSPEHLELLRQLDARSLMAVPMVGRGRVLGALVFISAGPDRRYDENDLRLAQEIAARTALAVDNSQLYREAQKAIAARENLLAIVSHDLRNPLTTILMSTGMLVKAVPNDRRRRDRKQADAIGRAAARMDRMIRDLLDFASVENGRLTMDRAAYSTAHMASEALETHEELARAKSLRLSLEPGSEDLSVLCDRGRIQQVFANLLGNAIKFTPDGGSITVSVHARGDQACIAVSDSGPGIPREEISHIFERFWQARRTARLGTGLGLSIAKGIVESHGGRLWVESEVGKGSTFFFTCPLEQPQVQPTPPLELLDERPGGALARAGKTVLVVDDDSSIRDALRAIVSLEGYTPVVAANGAEALQYLRKAPPPFVILLDLGMPIMDGWTFLEERNRDPALKSIPVIVLSAQHDVEGRVTAENALYFQKPVHPENLMETMHHLAN